MSALALGAACFMLGAILSGWIVARTVLQAIHNRAFEQEPRQD
jgi:phosphate/sulfate permease